MSERTMPALIALSAAGLVGLISFEGYSDIAIIPVPGDVPTIGFGTTEGVKLGDKITPPKAVARALQDAAKFEGALRECVKVPLHQWEYDAYISFSYNVGSGAFCGSTLVKKLNAEDYPGACKEILRWNKFQGRDCSLKASGCTGIWNRRQSEYRRCMGGEP